MQLSVEGGAPLLELRENQVVLGSVKPRGGNLKVSLKISQDGEYVAVLLYGLLFGSLFGLLYVFLHSKDCCLNLLDEFSARIAAWIAEYIVVYTAV